jgi:hypothetical protein
MLLSRRCAFYVFTAYSWRAFLPSWLSFQTPSEAQKANYSGKKKRHTRKHLAAVDENKRVLVLTKAREGKLHDKRFHDEDDMAGSIPDEISIEVDLGFLGLHKEYVNIRLPHRKPKGGELSTQQKEENRALSQSRVVCENAFAGVKRYSVVSAIYRNRKAGFDDHLMLTAEGLWNFVPARSIERSTRKVTWTNSVLISRQLLWRDNCGRMVVCG